MRTTRVRCLAHSGQRMPTGSWSCSPGRSAGRSSSRRPPSRARDGDSRWPCPGSRAYPQRWRGTAAADAAAATAPRPAASSRGRLAIAEQLARLAPDVSSARSAGRERRPDFRPGNAAACAPAAAPAPHRRCRRRRALPPGVPSCGVAHRGQLPRLELLCGQLGDARNVTSRRSARSAGGSTGRERFAQETLEAGCGLSHGRAPPAA